MGGSAPASRIRDAVFSRTRIREIYPLLFQADKALGDPSAAAKAVRFGLRLFPDNSELQRLNLLL